MGGGSFAVSCWRLLKKNDDEEGEIEEGKVSQDEYECGRREERKG